jgi:hypothetical protein
MKKLALVFISLFVVVVSLAQQEFHVFPVNHSLTPGLSGGNGTLQSPWDLQTALMLPNNVINGGDTIWLHEGVYNGRYTCTLKSTIDKKFITVSAFENDKVVLNGNVASTAQQTLAVKGAQVIFKNFEITWLGEFTRNKNDENFVKNVAAINHLSGKNCKFINLKIYNNPGLGFGSWKGTGGTLISECIIFNNGVINEKGRGGGEGIYVQNKSEEERIIKNNIIFGNYYKGIEVWSAGRDADFDYVKNITLENNVIFNSGLPSDYRTVDNIIIGTDDRNGINIAKNITVKNNILYHNTDFKNNQINGDAASLTIGYHHKTPVENIVVDNNIILGRNNALRVLYSKSLTFTNNIVYSGYVLFTKTVFTHAKNDQWRVNNNQYYTKKKAAFRVSDTKNYTHEEWKSLLPLDMNSQRQHISAFNLEKVLDITESEYFSNRYRVTLFNKEEQDVTVDFSNYNIEKGASYTIRDVENLDTILKSGIVNDDLNITVPMKAVNLAKTKTLDNFGVFIIDFNSENKTTEDDEDKNNIFTRIWRFLGF